MPGHRVFQVDEELERTADPVVRKATLRRAGRLFTPYKVRLAAVLSLIVFSAVVAHGFVLYALGLAVSSQARIPF